MESYQEILKNIKKINGIAVGFNTNVDVIIKYDSEMILKMIQDLKVESYSLVKEIIDWKGVIQKSTDYITGLCGCFEKGKASEWLISNKNAYQKLIDLLPAERVLMMGGQAGNMANTLSELNVPKIFVHTPTLPKVLKTLFLKNKNILMPTYDKKGQLSFKHPTKVEGYDESLHLHIISEFRKNDRLKLNDNLIWKCPRDNRFIATYDPPNSQMTINKAFSEGINQIAEESNVMILSGFHMLTFGEEFKEKKVERKLIEIFELITIAKEANPELMVHLELCSTKNKQMLELLLNKSIKGNYWDSMGCNERELMEILTAIGEVKLANILRENFTQDNVLEAVLKITEKLSLKRFHLHQFGCYLIAVSNNYHLPTDQIRKTLCFSAIATAHKALTGQVQKEIKYDVLINEYFVGKTPTVEFQALEKSMQAKGKNGLYKEQGILQLDNFQIVAIPTIIIDNPIYTVGLGDTISSTALLADAVLKRIKK